MLTRSMRANSEAEIPDVIRAAASPVTAGVTEKISGIRQKEVDRRQDVDRRMTGSSL